MDINILDTFWAALNLVILIGIPLGISSCSRRGYE